MATAGRRKTQRSAAKAATRASSRRKSPGPATERTVEARKPQAKTATAKRATAAGIDRSTPRSASHNTGKSTDTSAGKSATIAGIAISHPDRVIDVATGMTKLDLARYYDWIAPLLLREIVGRPVSLLRCPEGVDGDRFFQRHPAPGMKVTVIPATTMASAAKQDKEDAASAGGVLIGGDLIGVADRRQLIALVQFGVIELHPWGARTAALDIADRIVFDLDPDEHLPFGTVADAATMLRRRLDKLGLASFPKTTGGKGMHIVVPLRPGHPWNVVKAAAKALASDLARTLPEIFVAQPGEARRKDRIFIDYLRNDRSATAVAAWSARARPGLTVSRPLAWTDVTAKLDPKAFTVAKLLAQGGKLPADPWQDMATIRQSLTAARLKALGV